MYDSIFIILSLLFVKHWYVDFVNQSADEVNHKGIYLNWLGVKHSIKHGIGTSLCLLVFVPYIEVAILFGIIDFALHYHIDWAKMKFGNRDITTSKFWAQLGLDQLAHYLTYLVIVWMLV